jgi:hypothetical protein
MRSVRYHEGKFPLTELSPALPDFPAVHARQGLR